MSDIEDKCLTPGEIELCLEQERRKKLAAAIGADFLLKDAMCLFSGPNPSSDQFSEGCKKLKDAYLTLKAIVNEKENKS